MTGVVPAPAAKNHDDAFVLVSTVHRRYASYQARSPHLNINTRVRAVCRRLFLEFLAQFSVFHWRGGRYQIRHWQGHLSVDVNLLVD